MTFWQWGEGIFWLLWSLGQCPLSSGWHLWLDLLAGVTQALIPLALATALWDFWTVRLLWPRSVCHALQAVSGLRRHVALPPPPPRPRTDWRHSLWEYPRDPEGCACCECFRIAQSICILFWAMAVIFAHLSLGWWRGNLWGNFVFEFLESFTYLIG